MEFNNIYIPNDIINIIYKNLPKLNDKMNFTKVNKFMFKNNYNKTQIYTLELYLNLDYLKFYNLINKYDYPKEDLEYLKKICFEALKYMNTIWLNNTQGFGDYRFIFELLYKYDIINKYIIQKNTPHFYKHFYSFLDKSIVKNDREKTIENINNSDMLFALKRKFKPRSRKNKVDWVYLVE